jgi:hypothetical protein
MNYTNHDCENGDWLTLKKNCSTEKIVTDGANGCTSSAASVKQLIKSDNCSKIGAIVKIFVTVKYKCSNCFLT